MLSIGNGPKHALLFACPHPNEPIGSNMLYHLAGLLCEDPDLRDRFGYTWHLIPCIDPDGTRLNEGWFGGPFTPGQFARHYYRPSSTRQVEWTFPISYKQKYFDRTQPETFALMRVIDELQPEFMVSLHNAVFGGVYYYISRAAEPLYETLSALPDWEGLPLQLGEPEVPWLKELAPAIFEMFPLEHWYDYLEANGGNLAEIDQGNNSAAYASKYGTFTLIIEMAYYDDPRVMDQTPTDRLRRDTFLAGLDVAKEGADLVNAHYQRVKHQVRGRSPLQESVEWWVRWHTKQEAARQWAETAADMQRPATVAELFSSTDQSRLSRLLGLGMLLRTLEGELAIGNGTPEIRASHRAVSTAFDAWTAELEASLSYRIVPIRNLVAVQLGAVLAAANYLSQQRGAAA
jgi:hypothetical protein